MAAILGVVVMWNKDQRSCDVGARKKLGDDFETKEWSDCANLDQRPVYGHYRGERQGAIESNRERCR